MWLYPPPLALEIFPALTKLERVAATAPWKLSALVETSPSSASEISRVFITSPLSLNNAMTPSRMVGSGRVLLAIDWEESAHSPESLRFVVALENEPIGDSQSTSSWISSSFSNASSMAAFFLNNASLISSMGAIVLTFCFSYCKSGNSAQKKSGRRLGLEASPPAGALDRGYPGPCVLLTLIVFCVTEKPSLVSLAGHE